jgi:hypothetical protein
MRPGWVLAANQETKPTDAEQEVIRAVIRDWHVLSVGEWLIHQKPKIRAKFMAFLQAVQSCPMPTEFSRASIDLAERFARDITQLQFHPVLRTVIDNTEAGEYADVLHILSVHMERGNVMASAPSVRDSAPQLFKAIAQEDHVYSRPHIARHELPKMSMIRALNGTRMVDPVPSVGPTRSFKPTGVQRSRPFATFPSGELMQSMTRSQFIKYPVTGRQQPSTVCDVLNAPTCL